MKPKNSSLIRRLTGARLIIPIIVAVVALAALAVSVSAWWSGARNVGGVKQNADPGQASQQRFPIVLLNLTRFGFEPSAMRIPAGRCQLAIRNMSGLEDIDLQVARKSGEQLLVEKYPKGRRHWEKPLTLPVGDYVISVADNPQWVFNLTVIPPGR